MSEEAGKLVSQQMILSTNDIADGSSDRGALR